MLFDYLQENNIMPDEAGVMFLMNRAVDESIKERISEDMADVFKDIIRGL